MIDGTTHLVFFIRIGIFHLFPDNPVAGMQSRAFSFCLQPGAFSIVEVWNDGKYNNFVPIKQSKESILKEF